MSVEALKTAHGYAAADGYIGWWEVPGIKRTALLHDNTVDVAERAFLQDVIRQGFWADPGVLGVYQELAFFGEASLSDQMQELRRLRLEKRWFNDEYRRHAEPLILASTDSVSHRLRAVSDLAREINLFNSEKVALGQQVLRHSHDPILDRLAAARRFKSEVGLFDSDYKDLALAMIRNSYDTPANRLKALDALGRDVNLWQSERDQVLWYIDRDDQSLE